MPHLTSSQVVGHATWSWDATRGQQNLPHPAVRLELQVTNSSFCRSFAVSSMSVWYPPQFPATHVPLVLMHHSRDFFIFF